MYGALAGGGGFGDMGTVHALDHPSAGTGLLSRTSHAGSLARLILLPLWPNAVTGTASDVDVRKVELVASSSMPMDLTTSAESMSTLRSDLRRANRACWEGTTA